jgi:outer membrane lipoprotein
MVLPPELETRVDRSVAFTDLLASPGTYRGRTIVVGGEVLSATFLQEGTRIEVLQIPLDSHLEPGRERTASEGRFLAIERKSLDPATIPAGTRVTVVGEVTEAVTLPLDARRYTYPTVEVKALTVWPKRRAAYWLIPYPLVAPVAPPPGR